ncbi:T6SS phospholipase effector Tle1-like catalytic domain-containing protein [Aspergillus undulatus]|uniref:T6SS phospholipase effector Tle1-like catalytic domain-containing protein n=1 Tax=Aspergillus undulatus TaxID=1810928 RepID=UPI003CCD7D64
MEGVPLGPVRPAKQFVLCFDGTGNKFAGDESDSNVLKIFRMLDRSQPHQFHYYQPGIGTYVTSTSLSHTSRFSRIKSAYLKAKDSAIGSSFDAHVMGGYKFLMRFYNPGDEIYFIGFSRGAYIARFLAEMLDFIGLLEAGNEELTRFAWKTFAKWQQRGGDSEEDKEEKEKLFRYMKAFRETFSRPITRIRFMGLFDTVNSVPRFESAWMQRSKFPYTARSSAKVIRHAVGIDERRAKFRQDLISEVRPSKKKHEHHHHYPHLRRRHSRQSERPETKEKAPDNVPEIVLNDNENADDKINGGQDREKRGSIYRSAQTSHESLHPGNRYRATSPSPNQRRSGLAVSMPTGSTEDVTSIRSGQSGLSLQVPMDGRIVEDDDDQKQDIQEVWFPGGHADIGGGWALGEGENWALSHAPLVWMVQEAQAAGLEFDPAKMKQFECLEEFEGEYSPIHQTKETEKTWCEDPAHEHEHEANGKQKDKETGMYKAANGGPKQDSASSQRFKAALYASSTEGLIHDSLSFGNGLPPLSVIAWKIMEYLPFRRMDLREDGSWEPIRWPLPCGEVRDMPTDAQIHVSAIRRMKKDPNYRPGNLILGGGGRGVRFAPEEAGIGEWMIKAHEGDVVREIYVRKSAANVCKDEHN